MEGAIFISDGISHFLLFFFPARTESCDSSAHKLLIAFQRAVHELFSIQKDLLNNSHTITIEMGLPLSPASDIFTWQVKEKSILRTHEKVWFMSHHKLQKMSLSLWGADWQRELYRDM